MIYYCRDCNTYFTEKNMGYKKERLCRDEYDNETETIEVCPYCGSDDIKEYYPDDEEICDLLNEE